MRNCGSGEVRKCENDYPSHFLIFTFPQSPHFLITILSHSHIASRPLLFRGEFGRIGGERRKTWVSFTESGR